MAAKLSITYFASPDLLGMVSDEEYERFKTQLLETFQEEWPDATVAIEDDEDASLDLDGVTGQAEQDVRDRIEDIVSEVIDSGAWQDEEEDDFLEDEEETGGEDEQEDKY